MIRRLFAFLLIIVLAAGGVRLAMPFMARHLLRSDPLKPADVIVVLGSTRLERTLEAGTLFREGWAPRILLLRPRDEVRDSLRGRFGIQVPVLLDIQESVLRQMNVPSAAIAESPRTQESTRGEAAATAEYARQKGYRRMIVVTSPYHASRAGALFDRAMKGSCEVIVHPDRYEEIDPNRWWLRYPERYDVTREYLSRIYALFW